MTDSTTPRCQEIDRVHDGKRDLLPPFPGCIDVMVIEESRNRAFVTLAHTLERELRAAVDSLSEGVSTCEWTSMYPDEVAAAESDSVQSGCGHEWANGEDADPPGRWMNFCPFCGGKVVFAEAPK